MTLKKTIKKPLGLPLNRTWDDLLIGNKYDQVNIAEWRAQVKYSLMRWAEEDDSFFVQDFCTRYKISRFKLYAWADQYPDLKDALDHAKLLLASRKLKGALFKNLDKEVVYKDMHKLDPEYLEINKYHADLKRSEQPEAQQTIVIQEASDSGIPTAADKRAKHVKKD